MLEPELVTRRCQSVLRGFVRAGPRMQAVSLAKPVVVVLAWIRIGHLVNQVDQRFDATAASTAR